MEVASEVIEQHKNLLDGLSVQKPAPQPAASQPQVDATKEAAATKEKERLALEEKEKAELLAKNTKPNLDDLSEEDFLALYEKRTGQKAKSLDDLKPAPKALTAEEKEKEEVREKTEALEWGLANKVIEKDLYDKSLVEKSKNKRDIALALFAAELQEEEKGTTPEDAEELFKDIYGENEDPHSVKYKKGQKAIIATADAYLSQYNVVDELPAKYREAKTADERRKTFNKQVSAVSKELPKELSFLIPYEVGGEKMDFDYKVPVPEDVVSKLVKEFTRPGMEDAPGFDNKENITAELNYHVRARMVDNILAEVIKNDREKIENYLEARLKNARNPQQSIAGKQERTAPKEKPDHSAVLNHIK